MHATPESEFAFELRTCRWAEREWPPAGTLDPGTAVLVARQLGTERRRWDTIVVECDGDALARRARFGPERLDSDLLHVVRNAPAGWAWYRDALPDPGYPWRYVRETIHRADDRDILDVRRKGNRLEIRRRFAYPDWVKRIVAVENKPDLDASAARALRSQVERDVALSLADEVWVATNATGERVEPALLERIPVEAGILVMDFESGEHAVAWHPRTLAVSDPGTRIVERPAGGKYDLSAARFEYVSPGEKAEKRLAIAERAYERGWRSYADTMRTDCRHFHLRREGDLLVPWCAAKECTQTPRQCGSACADVEPEPPAWRQRGWPIEGGPGKSLTRLLAERRNRTR